MLDEQELLATRVLNKKAKWDEIQAFIDKNYVGKFLIREKMEKYIKTNEHVILGGRRNGKTLEYGRRLGRIEMCEELLNNKTS